MHYYYFVTFIRQWQRKREELVGLTLGKVILMRLNRLCKRSEMRVLPPPGGPMDANRNVSYQRRHTYIHKHKRNTCL